MFVLVKLEHRTCSRKI